MTDQENSRITLSEKDFGAWRSPVARLLWEQEVPGSNPGAPILYKTLYCLSIGRCRLSSLLRVSRIKCG